LSPLLVAAGLADEVVLDDFCVVVVVFVVVVVEVDFTVVVVEVAFFVVEGLLSAAKLLEAEAAALEDEADAAAALAALALSRCAGKYGVGEWPARILDSSIDMYSETGEKSSGRLSRPDCRLSRMAAAKPS
jgi:hypothetical protein